MESHSVEGIYASSDASCLDKERRRALGLTHHPDSQSGSFDSSSNPRTSQERRAKQSGHGPSCLPAAKSGLYEGLNRISTLPKDRLINSSTPLREIIVNGGGGISAKGKAFKALAGSSIQCFVGVANIGQSRRRYGYDGTCDEDDVDQSLVPEQNDAARSHAHELIAPFEDENGIGIAGGVKNQSDDPSNSSDIDTKLSRLQRYAGSDDKHIGLNGSEVPWENNENLSQGNHEPSVSNGRLEFPRAGEQSIVLDNEARSEQLAQSSQSGVKSSESEDEILEFGNDGLVFGMSEELALDEDGLSALQYLSQFADYEDTESAMDIMRPQMSEVSLGNTEPVQVALPNDELAHSLEHRSPSPSNPPLTEAENLEEYDTESDSDCDSISDVSNSFEHSQLQDRSTGPVIGASFTPSPTDVTSLPLTPALRDTFRSILYCLQIRSAEHPYLAEEVLRFIEMAGPSLAAVATQFGRLSHSVHMTDEGREFRVYTPDSYGTTRFHDASGSVQLPGSFDFPASFDIPGPVIEAPISEVEALREENCSLSEQLEASREKMKELKKAKDEAQLALVNWSVPRISQGGKTSLTMLLEEVDGLRAELEAKTREVASLRQETSTPDGLNQQGADSQSSSQVDPALLASPPTTSTGEASRSALTSLSLRQAGSGTANSSDLGGLNGQMAPQVSELAVDPHSSMNPAPINEELVEKSPLENNLAATEPGLNVDDRLSNNSTLQASGSTVETIDLTESAPAPEPVAPSPPASNPQKRTYDWLDRNHMTKSAKYDHQLGKAYSAAPVVLRRRQAQESIRQQAREAAAAAAAASSPGVRDLDQEPEQGEAHEDPEATVDAMELSEPQPENDEGQPHLDEEGDVDDSDQLLSEELEKALFGTP
ncbi:hypothetical protein L228DRAFT_280872 [Xylona heveae TC161]|uniref:Uncharacterized protein n=1 Tax=Xylona heveae (strain CBS 132557 / TC161) TaxID=1328760 RepID=A0A165J2N3_XYLHT|nr:hypothetical protein L228DRAFT_280872 [Xylona heveae TC161]KZF25646.1 hypothetical protein L228DRAFT_280872 [Xylona heveae TC161]